MASEFEIKSTSQEISENSPLSNDSLGLKEANDGDNNYHCKEVETVEEENQQQSVEKDEAISGKEKLQSWLNKSLKIEMSDGRILIGNFLCTDRDANVILGACTEFLNAEVCGFSDEPRILGLVMVPGKHIMSMHLEVPTTTTTESKQN